MNLKLMMSWNSNRLALAGIWLFAAVGAFIISNIIKRKYPDDNYNIYAAAASFLTAAALFLVNGTGISIIQQWCACQILIYGSVCDIATREVPDHIHLLLLLSGFIYIPNWTDSLAALILIPLPFLLVALAKPEQTGGADIKLMTGVGFILGIHAGTVAAIIGLLLAILCRLAYRKQPFALIPYLSVGAFVTFLIFN